MSFELHISIPENSPAGQIVQRVISAEHVTAEQAVTRILTDAARQPDQTTPTEIDEVMARVRAEHPTYASLFGSVKGPGAHGSKEAVDQYIAELRSEW